MAELGVVVNAVEREEVIGDGGVWLGQHALDVGAGGTAANDGEEPHLASLLSANMVMPTGAKLKWATKVSHSWLR